MLTSMKLPRWLSPAPTIEAETGWPRALCRRFARSRRVLIVIIILWTGAVVYTLPPVAMGVAHLLDPEPDPFDGWILGLLVRQSAIFCAVSMITTLGMLAVSTWQARRRLRRFLASPWCLNCRYPIPVAPDSAGALCPECGEPIPPEIAKLAAEQAGPEEAEE